MVLSKITQSNLFSHKLYLFLVCFMNNFLLFPINDDINLLKLTRVVSSLETGAPTSGSHFFLYLLGDPPVRPHRHLKTLVGGEFVSPQAGPAPMSLSPFATSVDRRNRGGANEPRAPPIIALVHPRVVVSRQGALRLWRHVADNLALLLIVDVGSVVDVQLVVADGALLVRRLGADLSMSF